MHLERLIILDFRNYSSLNISLSPSINVFFGENAAGKTNVLESIYLLSTARSHRGARDWEMVKWDKEAYSVAGIVIRDSTPRQIEIRYSSKEKKKQVRIDSVIESQVGRLLGHVNSVVFSPEDIELVRGAPSLRRRYFDRQISQIDPVYYRYLVTYHKALSQRNALLKMKGAATENSLAVWDEQIADAGSRIVSRRHRVIRELSEGAGRFFSQLSTSGDILQLTYSWATKVDCPKKLDLIRDRIMEGLRKARREEMARGITTVGPHRDDIVFTINGENIKSFASQGQRRMSVLGLKMAEVNLMKEETGQTPLLLLDDVASELDPNRRDLLIQAIQGKAQVIITTTSLLDIGRLREAAALFEVSPGPSVRKVEGKADA